MIDYTTINDVETLWRTLTSAEQTKASALITTASSIIRIEGKKVGKDTDDLFENDEDYSNMLTAVTVSMVSRAISKDTAGEPMSQVTQSALGYSVSGTYTMPGRDLYLLNNEKSDLGLSRRQRIGGIEFYGINQNGNDTVTS